MKQLLILATKGGVGKTTLVEALRQALKKVEIIDLDHQKTITSALEMAGVALKNPGAVYKIIDTPPYNDQAMSRLIAESHHILIPIKLGYQDIIALRAVYKRLKSAKAFAKTCVVINEVRQPLSNESKEVIECLRDNYPAMRIANTMLSKLDDFVRMFRQPLANKGLQQITTLIDELGIKNT